MGKSNCPLGKVRILEIKGTLRGSNCPLGKVRILKKVAMILEKVGC